VDEPVPFGPLRPGVLRAREEQDDAPSRAPPGAGTPPSPFSTSTTRNRKTFHRNGGPFAIACSSVATNGVPARATTTALAHRTAEASVRSSSRRAATGAGRSSRGATLAAARGIDRRAYT
jgi:hypothetical protein